jgi:hypothetical protein
MSAEPMALTRTSLQSGGSNDAVDRHGVRGDGFERGVHLERQLPPGGAVGRDGGERRGRARQRVAGHHLSHAVPLEHSPAAVLSQVEDYALVHVLGVARHQPAGHASRQHLQGPGRPVVASSVGCGLEQVARRNWSYCLNKWPVKRPVAQTWVPSSTDTAAPPTWSM